MGQILELFLENPTKNFHIRGIARLLKIPKTTVSYKIKQLIKKNLVIKEKKQIFTSFRANETNTYYKFEKKQYFLRKITESRLIEYFEQLTPKCIYLFGSFAKGEYDINSDIDIFIQCNDQKIDLKKYEKKLKHKINILFELNINKLSKELLNNIINGTKLSGYLKIK